MPNKLGFGNQRRSSARSAVTAQYPLRKVISEGADEYGLRRETLECGHTVPARQDLGGPTQAARRRCRKCFQEGLPK